MCVHFSVVCRLIHTKEYFRLDLLESLLRCLVFHFSVPFNNAPRKRGINSKVGRYTDPNRSDGSGRKRRSDVLLSSPVKKPSNCALLGNEQRHTMQLDA